LQIDVFVLLDKLDNLLFILLHICPENLNFLVLKAVINFLGRSSG
jgi:hypothetical protein